MGRWGVLARPVVVGLLGLLLVEAAPASAEIRARRVFGCRRGLPYCVPTAFAFGPGGRRVFYTEKDTGQIHVRSLRTGRDTLWTVIPNVATDGSQGLLGLALDPTWGMGPEHRWVYAYYTEEGVEDPGTPAEDTLDRNLLVRMRKIGFTLETETLLVVPGAKVPHNGGVLRFGPDGKLYVVVGEGNVEARAQDLADPAGKILRMNPDGSVPADNPFASEPAPRGLVYSFGHRNSFGFAFDPRTGRLWETENGPECNDEVNLVLPAGNYAWGPSHACGSLPTPLDTNQDGPDPRQLPKRTYVDTIALTGAAFCHECGLAPRLEGDLISSAFGPNTLWALDLNGKRMAITGQRTLLRADLGAIAVERGPDGRIYFSDASGVWVLVRRG